jgi:hypothetical protein
MEKKNKVKKSDWQSKERGSVDYVYLHGLWRIQNKKKPSATLKDVYMFILWNKKNQDQRTKISKEILNPIQAFETVVKLKKVEERRVKEKAALVKHLRVTRSTPRITNVQMMMDQSGFSARNPGLGSEHFDPFEYYSSSL